MVCNVKINALVNTCLICEDALCTKGCKYGLNIAEIIRSIKFENIKGAAQKLLPDVDCTECKEKGCVGSCVRGRFDQPVEIPKIMKELKKVECVPVQEVDISTELCGIKCENPFFLSSSVVGSNYEMVAKAFDMGFAGVAFKTVGMFVPEEVSPRFSQIEKEGEKFIGFKNIEQISDHTIEENLEFFRKLKQNYPEKIIIASIMGRDEAEWTKLAAMVEEAGADVIECNFSCPHMEGNGLGSDVGTNEELVALYTKATRRGTSLPILAKMTPNITNMEIPARAAIEAGADGIAAINTIKSIMNVHLNTFVSSPDVEGRSAVGGYSGKAVKPIALRFIYELANDEQIKGIPISGMGGITTWRDALEFILLGCSTVQITTSIMEYGYRIIDDLIEGLKIYMSEHHISSIEQLLGAAVKNIVPTEQLNRQSMVYPKFDRSICVGCLRCVVSCYDGGHQALKAGDDHKPVLIPQKCVGCQLCQNVCPLEAITSGPRVSKSLK